MTRQKPLHYQNARKTQLADELSTSLNGFTYLVIVGLFIGSFCDTTEVPPVNLAHEG